jgi:MtN3 and saliva related transmembrane protein
MHGPVEVVGTLAGTLTTLSFLPQVFKVVREHQTAGISLRMYAAFTLGVFLWFMYGMMIGSVSVIASNGVTFLLAGIVLVMKIRLDAGK